MCTVAVCSLAAAGCKRAFFASFCMSSLLLLLLFSHVGVKRAFLFLFPHVATVVVAVVVLVFGNDTTNRCDAEKAAALLLAVAPRHRSFDATQPQQVLYHIMSYRVTSHHIISSYHITRCHVMSYHIT